jgi:hypothetical protein
MVCTAAIPASADEWPSEVTAEYEISFAGFNVGSFDFRAEVGMQKYALAGEASVSAVFGAFKWRGSIRSNGVAMASQPNPKSYAFDFESNSNRGAVRMAFLKGHIIQNDVAPYKPYTPEHVPLVSAHLRDVFDPLSAVMALTRPTTGHPCKRRIPIFDGRQRFDLVLSPSGRKNIQEAQPSGQPGLAYICKVAYVPLGGHKQNSQTNYMATNPGMRVILREVPSANLFIPYEVRVPTVAGEAVLSSRRVNIVTSRRQRIALIH